MLGKSDTVTQFEIQIVKFTLNLKTPINFLYVFFPLILPLICTLEWVTVKSVSNQNFWDAYLISSLKNCYLVSDFKYWLHCLKSTQKSKNGFFSPHSLTFSVLLILFLCYLLSYHLWISPLQSGYQRWCHLSNVIYFVTLTKDNVQFCRNKQGLCIYCFKLWPWMYKCAQLHAQ